MPIIKRSRGTHHYLFLKDANLKLPVDFSKPKPNRTANRPIHSFWQTTTLHYDFNDNMFSYIASTTSSILYILSRELILAVRWLYKVFSILGKAATIAVIFASIGFFMNGKGSDIEGFCFTMRHPYGTHECNILLFHEWMRHTSLYVQCLFLGSYVWTFIWDSMPIRCIPRLL